MPFILKLIIIIVCTIIVALCGYFIAKRRSKDREIYLTEMIEDLIAQIEEMQNKRR